MDFGCSERQAFTPILKGSAQSRRPLGELPNVKVTPSGNGNGSRQFDDVFIKRSVSSPTTPTVEKSRSRRSRRRSTRTQSLPDPVIAKWDLTWLVPLSPDSMLQTLEGRYAAGCYYTFAGVALVAINPFQQIKSLYSTEGMEAYRGFGKECRESLPPHLFSIAEEALANMHCGLSVNQSIVISGESGAGKTFSARSLMEYFVMTSACQGAVMSEKVREVADKIVMSNPLLEAFGNACTCRNSNSSRFGKYIKLQYDRNGQIVSAEMQTYLMEKTRVTYQADGEGNYHVFYQLVNGASDEERQLWHLPEGSKYRLLPKASHPVSYGGSSCTDAWQETCAALQSVGVSKSVMKDIGALLSALLHLGELDFTEDVSDSDDLRHGAELLGLSSDLLLKTISHRQITAGANASLRATAAHCESFSKPCEPAECRNRRDAIAKLVYSRLFDWLVAYVNDSLCSSGPDSHAFIGLLDVYGFENFARNSLEQLCINYANERLHNLFVQRFIKSQQTEYGAEGLDWTAVDYQDNSACLVAMDGRSGVFAVLNEECQLNRNMDSEAVAGRLLTSIQSANYAVITRPPSNQVNEPAFQVSHYAGTVVYSTGELVEKNKDNVASDLLGLLSHSSKDFIVSLADQCDDTAAAAATTSATTVDSPVRANGSTPRRQGLKRKTVVSKFKASVDSLAQVLDSTTPHYIRCIKPNSSSRPCQFDQKLVSAQLTASSVFETVTISHAGFPVRLLYSEFLGRYDCILRRNRLSQHHKVLKVLTPKGTPLVWPENKRCRSPLEMIDSNDLGSSLTIHTSLSTRPGCTIPTAIPEQAVNTPRGDSVMKSLQFNDGHDSTDSASASSTDRRSLSTSSVRLHAQAASASATSQTGSSLGTTPRRPSRGTKRRLESQERYAPEDRSVLMTGEKVRTAALLAAALLGHGDLRVPTWDECAKENSPVLAEKVTRNSDLQQVACMGHTKIFLKESQVLQLERLRESVLCHSAHRLQVWWRRVLHRRHLAAAILQATWRMRQARHRFVHIREAAVLLQCTWRACPTYERKFLQKVITPVKEVESATGAQQCQLALAIPPTIPVAPTVPVALTDGSNSSASTAMDTVSCDGAGPCRSSHAVVSRKKPVTFSASALSSRTARQVDTRRRMATVRYLPKCRLHLFCFESALACSSVVPLDLQEPVGLNVLLAPV
ncbi:unconventional myosin-XIX-like isoform X2 [Sycon ciliatum]|uniref:unconventional myosin-XIX-like isoform X2 n=1 Tax=Sycon ciliatum TaxID=27933 RepID=UPI0020AD0802